jgi:hypothetical protein
MSQVDITENETELEECVIIFMQIPNTGENNCYMCKIWGFHGGDYDDYHLLGDDNQLLHVIKL